MIPWEHQKSLDHSEINVFLLFFSKRVFLEIGPNFVDLLLIRGKNYERNNVKSPHFENLLINVSFDKK